MKPLPLLAVAVLACAGCVEEPSVHTIPPPAVAPVPASASMPAPAPAPVPAPIPAPVPAAPPQMDTLVTVSQVKVTPNGGTDEQGRWCDVIGLVANNTDTPSEWISIGIDVYDGDGQLFGTHVCPVPNLPARASRPFRGLCRVPFQGTYRVDVTVRYHRP